VSRTNDEVERLLGELAALTKLDDGSPQSFRVRAYERARDAIRSQANDVAGMSVADLKAVDGIGESTARKIREYVDSGSIAKLEELRSRYPPELVELTRVPGLGPKTVLLLRDELGVTSVAGLKEALEGQRLRELPGMGERSEEKIGRALDRLGTYGKERRTPIADALPVGRQIVDALSAHPAVEQAVYCGSLRRFRDTVADIDVLAAATDPGAVMEAFVSLPLVRDVLAHGATKSSIITASDLQIDLRVVPAESLGAAILYFTGSKAHNIELRQRAIDRGWILNEYELADSATGEVIASRTEDEIYTALGLDFVPPELREGIGEVQAAAEGSLPDLVEVGDIRGDLHVHSIWSGDGRSSLEDMVATAAARGLDYVAITEHGEDLAINGLSRAKVLAELEALDVLGSRYVGLTILHGAELNIGPDGTLDYDDAFLDGFQWCVASVHSHFDLDAARQTERVVRAMEHPAVNAIGHLTGRRIGMRPGIELDVEAVLAAAAATGTALEINSHLDRLDVPSDLLVRARDVPDLVFVISTDAHHTTEYDNVRWGVANARRGWVDAARVANTWPTERFLEWAAAKRG
jgi:DNA polymerase (family 10)